MTVYTDEQIAIRLDLFEMFSGLPFETQIRQMETAYKKIVGSDEQKTNDDEELTEISDVEMFAMLAHEMNRTHCMSLGDFSQPDWFDAPDWQKNSAMSGVQAIMNNPDTTPEQSHQGWLDQKVADGWVYGEKKDPDANPPTHPCMCDYDLLPEGQRIKDLIFTTSVKTSIRLAGY